MFFGVGAVEESVEFIGFGGNRRLAHPVGKLLCFVSEFFEEGIICVPVLAQIFFQANQRVCVQTLLEFFVVTVFGGVVGGGMRAQAVCFRFDQYGAFAAADFIKRVAGDGEGAERIVAVNAQSSKP